MSIKNRLICAAKSAWYSQEGVRLEYVARREEWRYRVHQRPLVSVLIPTHERLDLLTSRCLPSVLAQTYPNLEIIVAAHGDGGHYGRVRRGLIALSGEAKPGHQIYGVYVPRERTYPPTAENHWFAGPVAPLNMALTHVTGLWIARIDDDDSWAPDHIEKALRHAQANDLEFVSAQHIEEREGALHIVQPYNVDGVRVGGTQTWLWRSYLRFMRWNPDCYRKRHDRVNDTDLQRRFVNAGVRMGYLPEVHAYVKPRPGERTVGLKAYTSNRDETERKLAFN